MDDKFVFISYCTKDGNKPFEICEYLENKGIKCWIAPRNITAGQSYPSEIMKGIKSCSAFLILTSSHTNNSEHVLNELEIAVNNKKTIIPFRLENVNFTDDYMYYLSRKHWINYFLDTNEALEILMNTLRPIFPFIKEEERNSKKVLFKAFEKESKNVEKDVINLEKVYSLDNKLTIKNKIAENKITTILKTVAMNEQNNLFGQFDIYTFDRSKTSINLQYDFSCADYREYKLLCLSSNKERDLFIKNGMIYDVMNKKTYGLNDEFDLNSLSTCEIRNYIIDSIFSNVLPTNGLDEFLQTIIQGILDDECQINNLGYDKFNNLVLDFDDGDCDYRIVVNEKNYLQYLEIKDFNSTSGVKVICYYQNDTFNFPSTLGYK